MKSWYIRHNNRSLGPYSTEELEIVGVSKEDYVWQEDLPDWIQAAHVPELNSLFTVTKPPPFTPKERVRKTEKAGFLIGRYLRYFSILFLLLIGGAFVYNYYHTNITPAADILAEFTDPETTNPAAYLNADGIFHTNLIGQLVVQGHVSNRATHTNYKDAVVRVTFFSATKSVLESKDFTMYQYFPIGNSQAFKFKMKKPGGSQTWGVGVVDAIPY